MIEDLVSCVKLRDGVHCEKWPSWLVMWLCADVCADVAGLPREEAKDAIFWDVFEVRNPVTGERAEPWVPCEAAAAKGQKFVLHKVRRCGDPAEEPCQFTMRFRWDRLAPYL